MDEIAAISYGTTLALRDSHADVPGGLVSESAGRKRLAFAPDIDVLQVPFTYLPDPVGGTEIYVASLVTALRSHGVQSAIAAPAEAEASYRCDDFQVFRFATSRRPTLENAYGLPDEMASKSFCALIDRLRPKIVHLHARTAAVSEAFVDIAHTAGAKVVFTYHTPTVSCARGTMMRMGHWACDGRLDKRRCSICVLQRHGVPPILRDLIARTPERFGDALGSAGFAGGPFTALRVPALIGAGHRGFRQLIAEVDHIVAVAAWVSEVLRTNGVPDEKLTVCRQGLGQHSANRTVMAPDVGRNDGTFPLRLGYFGRLDPTKGADILVEALARARGIAVELEIYGVRQRGSEAYAAELERAAATDPRIRLRPALPSNSVIDAMTRCDLVAVPSRWLETGPLVVLEAFAARTPVLGTRLGGIAELVTNDVEGVLIEGCDPNAWATAIRVLASDRGRVSRLRAGIRPPRTMEDVADDMISLYRSLAIHGDA
jgi:glycosyltransferase involved in cell wall biosynthesis